MLPTQPLRDEHRALLPELEVLRIAADALTTDRARALELVDAATRMLDRHLVPHADAEEAVLYPLVEHLLDDNLFVTAMIHDHGEVRRLHGELWWLRQQMADGTVPASIGNELRRVLYGLHALIRVHFDKEERLLLPVIDERLSEENAHALIAAMHRATTLATQATNA